MGLPLVSAIVCIAAFEALGQSCVRWAYDRGSRIRQSPQSRNQAQACPQARPRNHDYPVLAAAGLPLLAALACYAGVIVCLFAAYRYKGAGIVNTLWSGVSIVLMLLIGMVVFSERITAMEWVGVGAILAGFAIINASHWPWPWRVASSETTESQRRFFY
jgi:multidrug transporter EmrE-like cation transporter